MIRRLSLLVLACLLAMPSAWAMRTKKPQTFFDLTQTDQLTALNQALEDNWNLTNGRYTLENIAVNPDATRKGIAGDLVYAVFGGLNHLCINTSLRADTTPTDWTCINIGTLSTCPGGADGMVQFNDNGTCGGDAQFLLEKNLNILTVNGSAGFGSNLTAPASTVEIDPTDVTGITAEEIALRSSAQTITLADGTTLAAQRQNQLVAPTLNGVSGGSTETITNATTFYVSAPPSGSNLTFTNGPFGAWLESNSGGSGNTIPLLVSNAYVPAPNTTEGTVSMNFGQAGVQDSVVLRAGKIADFDPAGAQQSKFTIHQRDGASGLVEVLHIRSGVAAGVFGDGEQPNNDWDVDGELAVGGDYAFQGSAAANAPTNGAIIQGQVGIGTNGAGTAAQPTILGDLTVGPGLAGGQAALYLRSADGSNAQMYFTNKSDDDVMNMALTSGASSTELSPFAFNFDVTRNGFFIFDIEDNNASAPFDDEAHGLVIGNRTGSENVYASRQIHLSSGITVSGRYNYILAPTYNGVAGGASEVVNTPATLYVDNKPQGANVTWGEGPYSIWVDDGLARFDGGIETTSTATVTGTIVVSDINTGFGAVELAAGVWTPTTNNIANFGSSSASEGQYLRVGNVVNGSVQVSVDPTLSATSTELELDLPVASNFGATSDAAGSCAGSDVASEVAEIRADVSSDELEMIWVTTSLASHEMACVFTYEVK